ncbi:MAG TPA: hypothetical protein VK826_07715 [Bacteroidia bacterium]|nr:hypothetical protein [Bacteroidia bacterium]
MLALTVLYGKWSPESFIVGAILLFVGLLYQSLFSNAARVKRALKNVQPKKIGDFKSGEVGKIKGQIVFAGRTIIAPLSGRECVYYHIEVEERNSGGKNSRWLPVIDEKKKADVVLFDGENYAVVVDRKAQTYIFPDASFTSGSFDDALPEMEKYLETHKKKSTGILGFNKTMRYTEGILEEDEWCAVAGQGRWVTPGKVRLKLPVERVLLISSAPNVEVFLTDDLDPV